MIVYQTLSEAVVTNLGSQFYDLNLGWVALFDILVSRFRVADAAGLNHADCLALMFCSSKKAGRTGWQW